MSSCVGWVGKIRSILNAVLPDVRGAIILISVVGFFVLIVALKVPTGETAVALGILKSTTATHGGTGSGLVFAVELENGEEIMISPQPQVPFRKDRVVRIRVTPRYIGAPLYVFAGYVD